MLAGPRLTNNGTSNGTSEPGKRVSNGTVETMLNHKVHSNNDNGNNNIIGNHKVHTNNDIISNGNGILETMLIAHWVVIVYIVPKGYFWWN